MEVMISNPTFDFALSDAKISPFKEYYSSAPTSPSRVSEFYNEYYSASRSSPIQKVITNNDDGDGFAFCVSEESEAWSVSAEELFDGGKIKTSKTPLLFNALSPKRNKETAEDRRRGRERTLASLSSSNSGRRATRSHSPYRVSHYTWDEEQHPPQHRTSKEESSSNPTASPSRTSLSSSKSSRKWRLRDLLLFRSASEGRGSSKDPLRKYSVYKKAEQVKDSSFRSTDSPTRRRGPVSAHELHYAMKKAESEDLKKRTYLPYKQGILGRLAGLGSFTR